MSKSDKPKTTMLPINKGCKCYLYHIYYTSGWNKTFNFTFNKNMSRVLSALTSGKLPTHYIKHVDKASIRISDGSLLVVVIDKFLVSVPMTSGA